MEIRVEVFIRVEEPDYRYLQLRMKHGPLDDPAKQPKTYHLTPADADLLILRLQHGMALLRRMERYDQIGTEEGG